MVIWTTSDNQILKQLLIFKQKIIDSKGDDERQHIFEDEMHALFIENCHLLLYAEILECQKVIKEVKEMDFSRWCA